MSSIISYKITLFDDEMTFKQNLSLKKFSSVGNFSAQENGGLSSLRLDIDPIVGESSFEYGDIVVIKKSKKVIYSGYVNDTTRIIDSSGEYIQLKLIGLSGLLDTCVFTGSYSDTGSNIVKALIDAFNAEYSYNIFSYTPSTIPDTTGTLSFSFTNKTYLDAIKTVAETAGVKFFVSSDNMVYLLGKGETADHKISLGKEVLNFERTLEGNDVVNSLILKYSGGQKTYIDPLTTFKKKEIVVDKSSEISNEATADIFGAEYIDRYKDRTKKTSITIGNEYNFFEIKPLDMIKLRNTGETLGLLQVSKITYSLESARIELEKMDSLGDIIFS